jgi:hypothetical protein
MLLLLPLLLLLLRAAAASLFICVIKDEKSLFNLSAMALR